MLDTQPGDRWLLCSDGLSSYVSEERIQTVLATTPVVSHAAERLIKESLDVGAPDNVTVVVVDVDESADSATDPPITVGSAAAPLSFENEPARRSLRLPTLLLHPLKATAEDSHFEPESDEYLAELIAEDKRRARRRRITWLGLIALAVIAIVVAAIAGYQWTQSHYYVGASDGRVAIYRGVQQSIGPIGLSSVYEVTDIRVDDLPTFSREQIEQTINADSLREAREIVERLPE